MKKTEFVQIKGLDVKELRLKAKALREEIVNLVLDKNMKKLKDLKAIYKKKKDLARVLTVVGQKEQLQELEKVQKDSEKLSKPENQQARESESSDSLTFRSSDKSGTPSHSEFSEKNKRRSKKGAKK